MGPCVDSITTNTSRRTDLGKGLKMRKVEMIGVVETRMGNVEERTVHSASPTGYVGQRLR